MPEAQPVFEGQHPVESHGEQTAPTADHASLKYSLLGPSLTKAGQRSVDQSKAGCCRILAPTAPALC